MGEKVVVSRKYSDALITHRVVVTDVNIAIEMDLNDYLAMLVSEIDGIPMLMTQAQLRDKLLARSAIVIADMKHSTIHNTPEFKA